MPWRQRRLGEAAANQAVRDEVQISPPPPAGRESFPSGRRPAAGSPFRADRPWEEIRATSGRPPRGGPGVQSADRQPAGRVARNEHPGPGIRWRLNRHLQSRTTAAHRDDRIGMTRRDQARQIPATPESPGGARRAAGPRQASPRTSTRGWSRGMDWRSAGHRERTRIRTDGTGPPRRFGRGTAVRTLRPRQGWVRGASTSPGRGR